MKTLVLGMGNTLVGDDGVGVAIVERLGRSNTAGDVSYEATSVSGIALLETICGYDRVIVIDTIRKAKPITGTVHVFKVEDLRSVPGPSPHYVSFPQMIEIGRRAGLDMPVDITVIGIEAEDMWVLNEGLSHELERCVPEITERIKEMVAR